MPSRTWTPAAGTAPGSIEELRKALTELAKKRKGKDLIAARFTKEHIFPGHGGSAVQAASMLAHLRGQANQNITASTFVTSSMDQKAQDEVLNWISKVSGNLLTFADGTWTIGIGNTTVDAVHTYNLATVDIAAMKAMNSSDRVSKSRKWLTEGMKRPRVACQFDEDGTPVIYHLDF